MYQKGVKDMKAFGKIVTFSMIVGATAAGVYHYLQKKDAEIVDADDFDDLDNFEDIKEEEEPSRSYVDLGKAGAKVGEAADKAKAAVIGAYEKVKESGAIDKAKEFAGSAYEKVSEKIRDFTSEKSADADTESAEEEVEVVKASDEAEEDITAEGGSTEDFFDDKDEA